MVQTKKLIPEVYSQSFDMSVFTGILDLVYTARELDSQRAKVCHSPFDCFQEDLQRLVTLFNLPLSSSRQLISDYRHLIKNKGTSVALQAAVAFSAALTPQESLVQVVKTIDSETHTILLTAYVDFQNLDDSLLEFLIYKIAPVGVAVQVKPLQEMP